jgi:Nitrate and nitrite sensing
VTDRTTVTPDQVEDRLRRTFAARAGDMAPDDGGRPADLRLDEHATRRWRPHLSRRALQAAAVVTVLALAAAGGVMVARGAADDDDSRRVATVSDQPTGGEIVPAVTAPRNLVRTLQYERELATATLVGIDEALVLPVTDIAQARAETDAASATFRAFVAASPNGAAYEPALDTLASLGQLRADVDADAGPQNLDNAAVAQSVFEGYTGIVHGLLDAQNAFADGIDDPDVGAGALAYGSGLRLDELTRQLRRAALMAGVLPGTESIRELSRVHAEVQEGLDALDAETTGTAYEEAATTALGDFADTGLLDATGAGLAGTVDVVAIVGATDQAGQQIWPAYLDRVEQILNSDG